MLPKCYFVCYDLRHINLNYCFFFVHFQSWARFILQQLSSETMPAKSAHEPAAPSKEDPETDSGASIEEKKTVIEDAPTEEDTSHISKLFGVEQEQTSRCTKCSTENSKVSPVLLSSLMLQELDGDSIIDLMIMIS